MDAKLMVATGSGDVQQLKDLVKKEDSKMMVVVMAKQAASAEKPRQGNMDPHLLALASSGSYEELKSLLSREDGQASGNGTDGSLPMRRVSVDTAEGVDTATDGVTATVCASSSEKLQILLKGDDAQACANNGTDESLPVRRASDDIEANESILEGVTAEGDTALHVVATCGQGDGDNFLKSARIIYGKANHLLFVQNKNGDIPLHCAARAGKSKMVACLIELARAEGEASMKELLRKENKDKETALNEAVRIGNKDIVDLLMEEDSELASFPEDGASPLYLAIVLQRDLIVDTFFDKGPGKLSFSGQYGQNVLHAAVLRCQGESALSAPLVERWTAMHSSAVTPARSNLTKLLEWNKDYLCPQNKDLTTQRDENGSTPLHFAAAIMLRSCRLVLEANADALYQPDHAGLFPIHVAASVGASQNVDMFLKKYPGSANLRDAKGRTFLHVAGDKKRVGIIFSACRNPSLSWIMNMRDNDGNTALHLAVETGSLRMFCHLLGNPQVDLNLSNNKGETPLDIAEYKLPDGGLYYNQNSEALICRTLRIAGAVKGVCRKDRFKDNKTIKVKHDERKDLEVLKDSTGTLCIGSVLIASVTFGATFAVPGGYIADDHNNGGTPTLARRYAFDAFIPSNTLAFVSSTMATVSLMRSGSPLLNPRSRIAHLNVASYLVSISITSLTAAFALGTYVVLSPVAHKTAVVTCVLSSLVLLYKNLEFIGRYLLLLPPLCKRKGPIWASAFSALIIMLNLLFEYWPLLFIFGWATHASLALKTAPPAQAPAPLS